MPPQISSNCQFLNPFQSVQLSFFHSSIFFKEINDIQLFYFRISNPMICYIIFINVKRFWRNIIGITSFGGRFCNHPFKFVPMQLEFPIIPPPISFIYIFLNFILPFLWFLLSLVLLNGGSTLALFYIYHPPTIYVMIFWIFVLE